MAFEASVVETGLAEGTVRSYRGYIREMINDVVEEKNRSMEGQLGGEGKIVEIDEAVFTRRKYERGRIPAGSEIIVFGITERDGGRVRVEDPELLSYIMRKEAFRTAMEQKKNKTGLRPPQAPRRRRQDQRPPDDEVWIAEGDFTTVINIGDDAATEEEAPQDDAPEGETVEIPGTNLRFTFDREMEEKERQLFGTVDRSKRNRTLLFVVKDRKAATLIPIIRKYVKPGSIIFSDSWSAYYALDGEFKHFVVVHKRRFVKYLLFENRLVLKVTTNHIERIWVEMRLILRGVPREEFPRRLNEVPYRLMTFVPGRNQENLEAFLKDLAATTVLAVNRTPSAFTPVVMPAGN